VALRTFSNWYEEHYNAPYEVFQSLSNLAGVPLPEFEEIMTEHEWRSRRSRAAYRSRWGRAGVGNGGRPQQGRQNCTKAAA
jgi:hypothetical protein